MIEREMIGYFIFGISGLIGFLGLVGCFIWAAL